MIAKHKFWRVLTRIHKWAGLILGIQIILWFASGFFMSFFDIENVRGNHVAEKKPWPLAVEHVISKEQAMALAGNKEIYEIKSRAVAGDPIWELTGPDGSTLIDAATGIVWQGASEAHIRHAAKRSYIGKGEMASVCKLDKAPIEYRGDLPVWQVQYDDKQKTRLYFSADTADLKAVRTKLWRVFDFMWMLHIMDYNERDNINLWWLKLASFAALMFALSGVGLVVHRVFLRPRVKKSR